MSYIYQVQFSIACNIVFNRPFDETPPSELDEVDPVVFVRNDVASLQDPTVKEILFDNPPDGCSLFLSQNGVAQICRGAEFKTYRKCFSPAMTNFSTNGTPTIFKELDKDSIETVSVLAYSPAAAILRRTSKDEPFVSHPVCQMLSNPTDSQFQKLNQVFNQNFEKLDGCVGNMGENGLSYRLECTFETKVDSTVSWPNLKAQFDDICIEMKALSTRIMSENGLLFPKKVFPLGLKTLCLGFKPTLDTLISKVINKEYISIKEKETAAAVENLLIFTINGNERGLSHSYFSHTGIRQNIFKLNFPVQ